jgi:DNA-binding transcriptional LysR family regulator
MTATIDLNKVAIFVRVVEAQSFTAAGAALGIPKSSVSRSVSQLEETLGARLLQRTTRKLSLTDAGVAYYERASRALAGIEEATSCVNEMQGTPRGTVRITAPVDLGVSMLAPIVTRFARKHRGIRVEISLSSRTVNLVEEGFDLALRAGRLRDSSLIGRRIGSLAAHLFASPGYLKRRGVPQVPAELPAHDCVVFRSQHGKGEWRLSGPGGEEVVEVTGPIAADDLFFVRKVALAGGGIAWLPSVLCARDVERGRLVRVLPRHASGGGWLHLVYPSSRHLPQRVALFRDFLLASLATVTWGE